MKGSVLRALGEYPTTGPVAQHWLVILDTMLDAFHMFFVALMTGTLLPDVNSTLESSTVA
jgi:hypothetical protein